MTTANIAIDRAVEVPRGTYSLQYSPGLVRTRTDFYDTLKIAAEMAVKSNDLDFRPPKACEEHCIYTQKSLGAKKLTDVEELKDYFGDNDENWYAWGWTLTGLRVPEKYVGKPYSIGEKIPVQAIETDITPYLSQIADQNFKRENWKDVIEQINKVKGEILVPYSRGQVIREIHPVFGIFTEINQTTEHNAPYALHGWLRENLDTKRDPISGHYDLAVGRWSYWHRDGRRRCLDVDAGYGRWDADSSGGFRPVRGSEPEILVVSQNVDVEQLRHEISEKAHRMFAMDLRKLPAQDLLEKYKQ